MPFTRKNKGVDGVPSHAMTVARQCQEVNDKAAWSNSHALIRHASAAD